MASILVVDATPATRAATCRCLRLMGYGVLAASSAITAAGALRQAAVDLIVLDPMMEGVDGVSFLAFLRQDPRWDDVPIVIYTALSDGLTFRRSRQMGADKYLLKSRYSIPALIYHVRRLLAQRLANLSAPRLAAGPPPVSALPPAYQNA